MQTEFDNKETPHVEIIVTLDNYKDLLDLLKQMHKINAISEYTYDLLETNFQRRRLNLDLVE